MTFANATSEAHHWREGRAAVLTLAGAALLVSGGLTAARDKPPPRRDEPRKALTGCESVGEGYVKLPDSDTCVKVSGTTRMEGAAIFGR